MPVMSDALVRKSVARAIIRYTLWFSAVMVVVSVTLFASDQASLGAGVLVSPILVSALGFRFKRTFGNRAPKSPRPGGIPILAFVSAMPGIVLIIVGIIIGGGDIRIFLVTFGTTYVGTMGLLMAMIRTLPAP
jgi:hypothetical protein